MKVLVINQLHEWKENCASEIRQLLKENKVLMVNIMGSPGCGKTSFILRFIEKLKADLAIGVIEGDITGKLDAEIIAAKDIPVVEINTEDAAYIESMSIKMALEKMDISKLDLIIVENIGSLIEPAKFDIGEDLKIALLSIPEGDDKIVKYPLMFIKADALVLNKYDTTHFFDFNEDKLLECNGRVQEGIEIFRMDSISGEGAEKFARWLKAHLKK
jgi:hydrogenase nickel incorporation protein HypB